MGFEPQLGAKEYETVYGEYAVVDEDEKKEGSQIKNDRQRERKTDRQTNRLRQRHAKRHIDRLTTNRLTERKAKN